MNEHLIDLMRFVVSINSENYHTYIDFSGHVQCVSIHAYGGAFAHGKKFTVYHPSIPLSGISAEKVESLKEEILADYHKAVKND